MHCALEESIPELASSAVSSDRDVCNESAATGLTAMLVTPKSGIQWPWQWVAHFDSRASSQQIHNLTWF